MVGDMVLQRVRSLSGLCSTKAGHLEKAQSFVEHLSILRELGGGLV
jgi:hypothetical protein